MTVKAFFHTYLWDILVVGALTLASSAAAIYLAIPKSSDSHIAHIVRDSTELMVVDLSKESAEVRSFTIQGAVEGEDGLMSIEVKTNAIRVSASHCANQYCVNQGWVSDANHPIVCAVNHVWITITASGGSDIVI